MKKTKVVFKDGRVAVSFVIEPAEMESWTVEVTTPSNSTWA
ncbi:hypothetical protein [Hymenobacter sp. J193]|nr:hypothetical protein [Hymenobacter sp. J193]